MYKFNSRLLKDKKKLTQEEKTQIINSFKESNDDDKVLIILSKLKKNEFKGIKEDIHNTFSTLFQQFKNCFSDYYFTDTENYPYSKKLDDMFFRFQNYKAISIKNPNYEKYIMNAGTKKIINEKVLPKVKDQLFLKNLDKMVAIVDANLSYNE